MSKTKAKVEEVQDPITQEEQMQYEHDNQQPVDDLPGGNVYESLGKFQQEVPPLIKNTQGYGYKYVDLNEIIATVQPVLAKHNLVVVQTLKTTGILTELVHTPSLSKIESYCEIPQGVQLKGQNQFQAYGSAITYFRRYQYTTILGLISDPDMDASGQTVSGKKRLTEERFANALEVYKAGDITLEDITGRYELTQAQKNRLHAKG